MTVEVSTTEAFHMAVAEAKQRGQRVTTLRRGKQGNASWVLVLSDAPAELDLCKPLIIKDIGSSRPSGEGDGSMRLTVK